MKAHDLIHDGLYLIGDSQIVRFNALKGCFCTLDGDFFGNPFADAESGEIECFTINKNWFKISPIPLTAEILGKNGFICLDDGIQYEWYDWALKGTDFSFTFYNDDGEIGIANCNIEFKYVHTLQHALRLCGLEDLADNFKI